MLLGRHDRQKICWALVTVQWSNSVSTRDISTVAFRSSLRIVRNTSISFRLNATQNYLSECEPIAVGMPIAGHPPQSGRIEARTGLRMMPTSPRSPLSFRTAGFPQYGWKDGVSDGAFPTRRSVQACSRHTLTTYWFASVLRASRRIHECPAQCRVGYAPMHRRGGWVILLPRGPRSSPGCAVPVCHHLIDPIRPTRRHITTSPQGGLYAMPSLCGSA